MLQISIVLILLIILKYYVACLISFNGNDKLEETRKGVLSMIFSKLAPFFSNLFLESNISELNDHLSNFQGN